MRCDKGVSPLIGMILGLGIIVGFIGIVQSLFVPGWMKAEEWDHYLEVKEEFERLTEKALDAANNGIATLTFDLSLSYPKYPFLLTPKTTTDTLSVKKIGTVTVYAGGNPATFDLIAIELNPGYYYLKTDGEVFILGEFFAQSGSPIGDRFIYINSSGREIFNLILINAETGDFTGGKRLHLYGNTSNTMTLENTDFWINITVDDPDFSWYVRYLENVTGRNAGENYINISATNAKLYLASVGFGTTQVWNIVNVSGGGTFTLSNGDGTTVTLDETGTTTVDLTVGNENNLVASNLYLTGFVGAPNTEVGATIIYDFGNGKTATVNTTWYTTGNGYLQLPVSVPLLGREVEGNNRLEGENLYVPDSATITLTLPNGEQRTFNVQVSWNQEGGGGMGGMGGMHDD